MDSGKNEYHISFVKLTTEATSSNRNMIIQMVTIWFVAIFEKPVPEPASITYKQYREEVKPGKTHTKAMQEVEKSALPASIITDEKYVVSKNALVHAVSDLFVRNTKQLKYYAIINP